MSLYRMEMRPIHYLSERDHVEILIFMSKYQFRKFKYLLYKMLLIFIDSQIYCPFVQVLIFLLFHDPIFLGLTRLRKLVHLPMNKIFYLLN